MAHMWKSEEVPDDILLETGSLMSLRIHQGSQYSWPGSFQGFACLHLPSLITGTASTCHCVHLYTEVLGSAFDCVCKT